MPHSATAVRMPDALHIVDAALAQAASQGLDRLTLRDLARDIGKSTTVIVNLFGSKAGLIDAMAQEAMQRDREFHDRFFAELAGLSLSRDSLVALLRHYLRSRSAPANGFVLLWQSLLVEADPRPERRGLMRQWRDQTEQAWRDYLGAAPDLADLSKPLVSILTIEQFYAGALHERADYQLIAAEGMGALADRALRLSQARANATFWYRENL
ncbi:hypothetical protein LTR94_025499, partial [Friedmanniomyces endolithicus]